MNFEKQYTDDDYANKACEANATGQMLYVLVTDEESDGTKKKVGNLVLAEPDYYVCYEANYTDGTINENLEAERAQKERERLAMLTLTAADVAGIRILKKSVNCLALQKNNSTSSLKRMTILNF